MSSTYDPPRRTAELTSSRAYVRLNTVQANRLQSVLKNLSDAIRETEAVVDTMRAEHDPLAVHIFISRRQYRNVSDTRSGSRRDVAARLSWQAACELGFRGSLAEWERLMGAVSQR
ncbi:MAG: hypothetical protein QOE34_1403 [Verrucomicrobiota bacterium]